MRKHDDKDAFGCLIHNAHLATAKSPVTGALFSDVNKAVTRPLQASCNAVINRNTALAM